MKTFFFLFKCELSNECKLHLFQIYEVMRLYLEMISENLQQLQLELFTLIKRYFDVSDHVVWFFKNSPDN